MGTAGTVGYYVHYFTLLAEEIHLDFMLSDAIPAQDI